MSALRTFIIAQFAEIEMTVQTVDFIEEDTLVTLDTGREFLMSAGSDDDALTFADAEGYEVSFEMPEEGFED